MTLFSFLTCIVLRILDWNRGLRLINLTSCFSDPLALSIIRRLMIYAERINLSSSVPRKYSSRVSHICNITCFPNYQNHNSTWSAFIIDTIIRHIKLGELFFCSSKPIHDCFLWIIWKAHFSNHILMQIISQKVSASWSSMPIINSKERTFWPLLILSMFWLNHIKYDRHSIFIVVSYNSLICVSCITPNNSIAFNRAFSRFVIWYYDSLCWLESNFMLIFSH